LDLPVGLAAAKELTRRTILSSKIEASLKAMEAEYDKAQKEDLERQQSAATNNTPQMQRRVNPTAVKMVQDLTASLNNIKTDIQTTNLAMDEKVKQHSN